jgi:type 1 glutamine amidotransferase
VAAPGHPLVAGLADFTIVDERYSDLDHGSDPPTPLLVADGLPLLWARVHGNGRVVYDALGHHPASYAVPEHREIVRRAIRWASGAEVEASA